MRFLIIFFCFIAFLTSSLCASDPKPKLAVFDVTDKSKKFGKERLVAAAEFIRGEIIASNQFIVIPKERQDKVFIKEQKKESYKECYDQKCQIPLGQALSADTIVVPTITLFDGIYTLRLELIDLAKEATVSGTTVDFADQKSFRDSARKAVAKLLGLELPEEVKAKEEEKPAKEDNRYQGENFDAGKFSEPIIEDWVFFFEDKALKYYYNQRTMTIENAGDRVNVWIRTIKGKKITEEKNMDLMSCRKRTYYEGTTENIPPESYVDYLHAKVCKQ